MLHTFFLTAGNKASNQTAFHKLFQDGAGMGMEEAIQAIERLLAGQEVVVKIPDYVKAKSFERTVQYFPVTCRVDEETARSLATEYAVIAGFPSFAPLFRKAEEQGIRLPLYYVFVDLNSKDGAHIALEILGSAIAVSPNPTAEAILMFREVDWRPQLVGAMAMLSGLANENTIAALWKAFDSGSWVSPQLAVTAFRSDPDFGTNARYRIEKGCPINMDKLESLDWAQRHSAAGPISFAVHSSKALASLIFLCRQLPNASLWLEAALQDATIQQALERDSDNGEHITQDWQKACSLVFNDGTE